MIGCRDLVVHAGGRTILSVPALDVAAAQTLAVLGPNGAGKSTLLRALGLLAPHHGGEVLLDGTVARRAAMRDAVSAVLQRPILRRGTVLANAASGLAMRGVGRREARRRALPWLERFGVAHLGDRDAETLSGGEAQRVSLARALAVEPRVLLLDEPFAALDATTRTDLVADLRAALTELGAATVLVTHDRDEARALAGRTALLVDGTLRQVGATAEVLDAPADADCARLVGFTNLLPGDLVARPEHTVLVRAEAPPDSVVVHGRLQRIVALGGITRVDVTTDTGTLACLLAGDAPVLDQGVALAVAVPRVHTRPVTFRHKRTYGCSEGSKSSHKRAYGVGVKSQR